MAAAGSKLRELVVDNTAAEARRILSQPLPTPAVMSEEAIRVLRSIALNELAEDKDRVAAARALKDLIGPIEPAKDKLPPRQRLAMLDLERAELLRQIAEGGDK